MRVRSLIHKGCRQNDGYLTRSRTPRSAWQASTHQGYGSCPSAAIDVLCRQLEYDYFNIPRHDSGSERFAQFDSQPTPCNARHRHGNSSAYAVEHHLGTGASPHFWSENDSASCRNLDSGGHGDGVTDTDEASVRTDQNNSDTDGGGLSELEEINGGGAPSPSPATQQSLVRTVTATTTSPKH